MHSKDISQILGNLGYTDDEVAVYLALLRLGGSGVKNLTTSTKIHRTRIYDILERLIDKGLVSQAPNASKKHYIPEEPNTVIAIHEERLAALKDHLSDLEDLYLKAKTEPEAKLYTGSEGLKNVLTKITQEAHEVCIFGDGDAFETAIPGWSDQYSKLRAANGIKAKILLRGSTTAIEKIKKLRQTRDRRTALTRMRVLPESYAIKGGFDIYDDTVIFYSFDEDNVAVVIKNAIIASLVQTVFTILWDLSEQYERTLLR